MQHTEQLSQKSYQFTNRCSKQCSNHRFLLINEHSTQLNCQVTFCPKRHKSTNQSQSTFPVFSNDKKFFTSGFILQIDRKALQSNQHIEFQEYQRKVKQLLAEPKLIFPKPSKSNNYCNVCKLEYQNYFKHIVSQQHKEELENNEFTKQIESLAQQFKALHPSTSVPIPIQISFAKQQDHENNQENQSFSHQSLSNKSQVSGQSEQVEDQDDMQRAMFSDSNQESKGSGKQNNPTQQAQQRKQAQQAFNSNDDGYEDSSGSVEIIAIKPAKTPRNAKKEQENTSTKKKIKKTKKTKSNKKEKKNKRKSKKRKDSKKKKKHAKQKSKKRERQQSRERSQIRKKALKRRPLDPPPTSPPLIHKKMALRVGIKAVHPPENTTEVVLIEKSQIQDAQIDKSYEKILQNIVATINRGPPAEAPRQYRKIVNPIDSRITSSTRMTSHFGSVINCQSRVGSRQGLSSQQSQNNSQRMSLTSERSLNNLPNKNVCQVIIQDNQPNIPSISQKGNLSAKINFDKIVEKPDWQKLKQDVISSLESRSNIEKPKNLVISLQDQEQKEIITPQRKDLITNKFAASNEFRPQIKPNPLNIIKQNQTKFTNFPFPYLLACKNLPKHIQKKISLSFPLFRGSSNGEKKNDITQHQSQQSQLFTLQKRNSNMPQASNTSHVNPTLGKMFSQISHKNPHLIRKFNDNSLKEKNTGGIIDLQLQEIQQAQTNICNRQGADLKKTSVSIPQANNLLFPKFGSLQNVQKSTLAIGHNEVGKIIHNDNPN